LHGKTISNLKEWHNGDDDNDININDDGGEAPNHTINHEP